MLLPSPIFLGYMHAVPLQLRESVISTLPGVGSPLFLSIHLQGGEFGKKSVFGDVERHWVGFAR